MSIIEWLFKCVLAILTVVRRARKAIALWNNRPRSCSSLRRVDVGTFFEGTEDVVDEPRVTADAASHQNTMCTDHFESRSQRVAGRFDHLVVLVASTASPGPPSQLARPSGPVRVS